MVKILTDLKVVFNDAKIVFWDFDGVIKDSVDVKTQAFMELFDIHGSNVVQKVVTHHLKNGGISRFEKIPLYLESFAGQKLNDNIIAIYLEKLSNMVEQKVIDSPWVPGVLNVIKNKKFNQIFILVTGTPHDEIRIIIETLKINRYFDIIYGSPSKKETIVKQCLGSSAVSGIDCLYFGDSYTDFSAAKTNGVPFVYVNSSNDMDKRIIPTYMVHNFIEIIDG